MHEFSLMREVIEILRASARERGIIRIEAVRMTVGTMGCAFPPALETAFDVLSRGDPLLEGTRLEIAEQGVIIRCKGCGEESEMDDYHFLCRHCGGANVEIMRGEALTVDSYQGTCMMERGHNDQGEADEERHGGK